LQQTDSGPAFSRVIGIITRLRQARHLHWVVTPGQPDRSSIVIDGYAPRYTAEVIELLELLGLPAPTEDSERIILTVFLTLDGRGSGGLSITTRSVGYPVASISHNLVCLGSCSRFAGRSLSRAAHTFHKRLCRLRSRASAAHPVHGGSDCRR
jgi:hypothetical protein